VKYDEQPQSNDHVGVFYSMILLISLMSLNQTAHATPLITNFGNGFADGKHNAQDTFHSGGQRDASCPLSFLSISYCMGYHAGYDATWIELSSGSSR
jgi:hypothetical protein